MTKTQLNAVENKIPSTSNIASKSDLTAVENKIPNISNLATKTVLTAIENKIPSVSNLLKKTDYRLKLQKLKINFFFSVWVFFHEHSQFTGQQGKGEGIYLTPLYRFHPLHRHLDISRAITAESSPLHIAGSRT